ncbi:ABC transporter substrate-binding protein [Marinicrinis sediminis]|uniref:Probable sugar-binding periplasmic protein n=1 Tax=Marinicrinis sediminis TaxID=1652465 RepID=A0ABW5R9S9_9BACL
MKKALYLLMIVVLMVTAAAGCGSNNQANNETNQSSQNNNQTANENEKDAPPQKVELKVFMSFPRFQEQFESYFEQFKAKQLAEKNIDVSIKLEMPNSEQAEQILQTRLASNDAPDIFTLHAIADIPTFYKAGYLEDLSGQPFTDNVYESVLETVTYDGQVVALPLESLSWGYLYNKKIFNDLGITPPQTLTEMNAAIEKLNEANIDPFLLAFQESWIPQLMMALSLGGVVNSEQPDFIENMNSGQGSYADVKNVFNIIDLIMANGTDKPFEVGSAAGAADFANGKAAMWVQGPWMAESILTANPDMEIGVAPLPVSEDPAGAMINLATSTSLAVSPTSENKEVAMDLINYILDEQDSSKLFEQLKFNPVATMHNYETFPWVTEASDYVSQGKAYLDLSLPGGITDETAKLLQSYYAEDVSKEDIIKTLDKAWANAVKSNQ